MRKSISINSQRIVNNRQVANVVVRAKIVGLRKHLGVRDLFSWLAQQTAHMAERLALCWSELRMATALPAMCATALSATAPCYASTPAAGRAASYRTMWQRSAGRRVPASGLGSGS